jgi:hypothetical protein
LGQLADSSQTAHGSAVSLQHVPRYSQLASLRTICRHHQTSQGEIWPRSGITFPTTIQVRAPQSLQPPVQERQLSISSRRGRGLRGKGGNLRNACQLIRSLSLCGGRDTFQNRGLMRLRISRLRTRTHMKAASVPRNCVGSGCAKKVQIFESDTKEESCASAAPPSTCKSAFYPVGLRQQAHTRYPTESTFRGSRQGQPVNLPPLCGFLPQRTGQRKSFHKSMTRASLLVCLVARQPAGCAAQGGQAQSTQKARARPTPTASSGSNSASHQQS